MFGRRKSKQPAAPTARLMVINPRAGEPLELRVLKSTISIGYAEDNDFVIRQASVSQHHAVMAQKDGHFELSDLSSTNGTFANGRRIDKSALVKIGDELWFGGTRFVLANPAVTGDSAGAFPEPRPTRRKTFTSRAALELALLALAIGFGSAQYLAYLLYHEQNRLILADAVPLPPPPVRPAAARVQSAAPSPPPVVPATAGPIAKGVVPLVVPPRPRPVMSRAASVSSSTAELPSLPAPKPVERGNDELAGAVSLMRHAPGKRDSHRRIGQRVSTD